MEPPEIRYARSGDVSIAYQVVGEGPVDLVIASRKQYRMRGWLRAPISRAR